MNCKDCKWICFGIHGYSCAIPNHEITKNLKLCRYFEEKMNTLPNGYKMNDKGYVIMDYTIARCRFCYFFNPLLGCIKNGGNIYEKIDNPDHTRTCEYYMIDESKMVHTWARTEDLEARKKDYQFYINTFPVKGIVIPKSDDEMLFIEKEIKEKEIKINEIIKIRKTFVKDFYFTIKGIDERMIETHIFEWGLKKPFLKFLLAKVNKKSRKNTKKLIESLRFSINNSTVRLIDSERDTYVYLLDGEKWFVCKRILSLIKKYAPIYINDILKVQYTDLSSSLDRLVFDDEKSICEKCGAENDIVAVFCNNCGNKF